MRGLWILVVVAAVAVLGWWWSVRSPDALVVYCAHDAMHAEAVLRAFSDETGIPVEVRYDNEATKSLGLVEAISRERAAPRCDVLWNNEVLGSQWLAREGLLAPHRGAGWQRIPDGWKDPEGRWVGFGGRLRVWIWNQRLAGVAPEDAFAAGRAAQDLAHMGYANPIFGTTRAHTTALWSAAGAAAVEALFADLAAAGAAELSGNATVKDAVVAGSLAMGWTDTDDAFVAQDAFAAAQAAGGPEGAAAVQLKPLLVAGKPVCVPNTAAVIRGSQRGEQARRLVDWLASEAGEMRLARSRARQIPLGPLGEASERELPAEVAALRPHSAVAWRVLDWDRVEGDVLRWLRARALR